MRVALVIVVAGAGVLAADGRAWAQGAAADDVCVSDSTLRDLPVRRVTIESRGGWRPSAQLPFGPGDAFDLQKLSDAHRAVSDAFNRDPLRDAFESSGKERLSIFFVSSCVTVVEGPACAAVRPGENPARCVDVAIRPFAMRLDMSSPAANAVSIPRSNRATAYSDVPAVLRAVDPSLGLSHDSRTGTSETLQLSTDLLALPSTLAGETPPDRPAGLDLDLRGSKSLDRPYYDAASELGLDIVSMGRILERVSAFASGAAEHQPLGAGRHFANAARVGAALAMRLNRAGVSRIVAEGDYRWIAHRFFGGSPAPDARTREHVFDSRLLLEGRTGSATWRLGAWHEMAAPTIDTFDRYTRTALVGGFQHELGRTEQTVGLEVLAGAGWASSAAPGYARFHAGAPAGQFLYDPLDAPALRRLPGGPMLRSLGRAQGSAIDGDAGRSERYWHVNLNLAFPLPRLSCPLIPAIPLFDDDAQSGSASPCRVRRPAAGVKTLKDSLVGMVKTGESFLAADIADELIAQQQMDPDEADEEASRRAAAVFAQIGPAVRYLAEKANLYAVKPLFMLDAGAVDSGGIGETRVGVGGGVQVTVAVAKLEVGYVRGVRRAATDPGGSLIARFVIVNLF